MSGRQSWDCPHCGVTVKKKNNTVCPHCGGGRYDKTRQNTPQIGVSAELTNFFAIAYPPEATKGKKKRK